MPTLDFRLGEQRSSDWSLGTVNSPIGNNLVQARLFERLADCAGPADPPAWLPPVLDRIMKLIIRNRHDRIMELISRNLHHRIMALLIRNLYELIVRIREFASWKQLERSPPRQKSRVEYLKAKVEPLLT